MQSEIYHEGRLDDILLADYRKSRQAFLEGDRLRADQLYSANRRLHAIDLYYEVALPEHVKLIHPLGTVLGRATYGDYLVCYQNCGVGSTVDHDYPVLGEGVCLFPGSRILGRSVIGNNVFLQANVVVLNETIPDDCIVTMGMRFDGTFGPVCKATTRSVKEHFFP